MKKLIVGTMLAAVLVLLLAATVSADNGPHGGWGTTTDSCANCHRTHTATSGDGYLLTQSSVYALCTSCHNGDGAYTNVVDGYYSNTWNAGAGATQGDVGHGLFAGGFVNARMATTWSGTNRYDAESVIPTGAPVTSRHEVNVAVETTIWGAGNYSATSKGTTLAASSHLECTSCHDPHGGAGRVGGVASGARTSSYRLLRFNPLGSNGFEVPPTDPASAPSNYFTRSGVTSIGKYGGVYVAESTHDNKWWYTPNTDEEKDPSLISWRARVATAGAPTPYMLTIARMGDYGGRYWVYQRPATTSSYSSISGYNTYVSCADADGSNLPTGTTTASPAAGRLGASGNVTTCLPVPQGVTQFNNAAPRAAVALWCGTCHDRYLAQSARSLNSTDGTFMYRHTASSNGSGTTSIACSDCHVAHGTSAVMSTSLAQNATLVTPVEGSESSNSTLLKMDNRGICMRCHGAAVNYALSPLVFPNFTEGQN